MIRNTQNLLEFLKKRIRYKYCKNNRYNVNKDVLPTPISFARLLEEFSSRLDAILVGTILQFRLK